jgi:hypothetical protein
VPSYPSPERAVRALARAVRYSLWRQSSPGVVPELADFDVVAARAVVRGALARVPDSVELSEGEVRELLTAVGITIEPQPVERGIGVVYTLHDDQSFGALISFGIGGVATELLGDRAFAVAPLTTADADDLIAAPRAAPLLGGYAGAEPADLGALADLALRLSALGDAVPEVAECTLRASAAPDGAFVCSAEVRVAPPTVRGDTGPRRLRGL